VAQRPAVTHREAAGLRIESRGRPHRGGFECVRREIDVFDDAVHPTERRFGFPRCTIELIDDAIEAIRGVTDLTSGGIDLIPHRIDGPKSNKLQDFGFTPLKTPKKSVASKATGVAKAKATRAARGTKGKNQKKLIKGALPVSPSAPTAPVPPTQAATSANAPAQPATGTNAATKS
jgi:hypothetical protein